MATYYLKKKIPAVCADELFSFLLIYSFKHHVICKKDNNIAANDFNPGGRLHM